MKLTVIEAKLALYHLLLKKTEQALTPNELELMLHLCRDDEVQSHLDKFMKPKDSG